MKISDAYESLHNWSKGNSLYSKEQVLDQFLYFLIKQNALHGNYTFPIWKRYCILAGSMFISMCNNVVDLMKVCIHALFLTIPSCLCVHTCVCSVNGKSSRLFSVGKLLFFIEMKNIIQQSISNFPVLSSRTNKTKILIELSSQSASFWKFFL